MPMSPGTYLRKRREAAGLDMVEVAAALIVIGDRVRTITSADLLKLEERLFAAEADEPCLRVEQARLLRQVMVFDLEVYELLLLHHHFDPASGLPEPQICRSCGCTWHDACPGSCGWVAGDPTLCTGCLGDDHVHTTRQGEFA
ncbi:RodZ family helix-turn-helix domain-containing protein [Novosphingobium clariflavum]|uniref:HTH cro/C1-type domain-containing protein n=1 Tax=Novosphingobium clariflavum TaxID=2029884 RepID=A0ABV6S2L1_9SPHN|nr:hypothetical protein [Novosphingobium clariflavum]